MKFCTECQSDVKNEDKSCDKCWSTLLLNKTDKIVKININKSNCEEFKQKRSNSNLYLMSCVTCKTDYDYNATTDYLKFVHQCEKCNTIHLINTDFEEYPYIPNIPDELTEEFKVLYGYANDSIDKYISDFDDKYKDKYNSYKSFVHRFTLIYLEEYYKFLKFMGKVDIHSNILNSLHNTAINELWKKHVENKENYEKVCEKIYGFSDLFGTVIEYEPYIWMSINDRVENHKKIIKIYEDEYNKLPEMLMRFWKIKYLRVDYFKENSVRQLFIRFTKTITVPYHFDMTIMDVKECVENRFGISVCNQKFSFNSKCLSDDTKTLIDYGVKSDSTLFNMYHTVI